MIDFLLLIFFPRLPVETTQLHCRMENQNTQQSPKKNQKRNRKRRRRPAVNRQAVDQHINFTEKFIVDVLQDDSLAVTKTAKCYRCKICDLEMQNQNNVKLHLAGKRHRHLCLQYGLIKNRYEPISQNEVVTFYSHSNSQTYFTLVSCKLIIHL